MNRNHRMPSDHGLSGLGLVMQLGGGLFGALTAMIGYGQLIAIADMPGGGSVKLWIFVLTTVGVIRSVAHRSAGTEVLYGHSPAAAIKRYVWLGGIHTALWCFFLISEGKGEASFEMVASFLILFGAWPTTMALALMMRGLSEDGRLPIPRDKGFDGLGAVMAVFSLGGLLYGLVVTLVFVDLPSEARDTFQWKLLIGMMIMLIVRSAIHVRSAVDAVTKQDLDVTLAAGVRYGNAGVTTAMIAGAVFLVIAMKGSPEILSTLLLIGTLTIVLLIWPMTVRRFVTERRFEGVHMDPGARGQRAVDGGLTSLGWLLLGLGVMALATTLPGAMFGGTGGFGGGMAMMDMFAAQRGDVSPWWSVGVAGLQVWAALELIGMTPRYKLVAVGYGLAASVITIYLNLPLLRHLEEFGAVFGDDPEKITVLGSLALALVVPGVTLLLACRQLPLVDGELEQVFD